MAEVEKLFFTMDHKFNTICPQKKNLTGDEYAKYYTEFMV
jgi:hypothetical protein